MKGIGIQCPGILMEGTIMKRTYMNVMLLASVCAASKVEAMGTMQRRLGQAALQAGETAAKYLKQESGALKQEAQVLERQANVLRQEANIARQQGVMAAEAAAEAGATGRAVMGRMGQPSAIVEQAAQAQRGMGQVMKADLAAEARGGVQGFGTQGMSEILGSGAKQAKGIVTRGATPRAAIRSQQEIEEEIANTVGKYEGALESVRRLEKMSARNKWYNEGWNLLTESKVKDLSPEQREMYNQLKTEVMKLDEMIAQKKQLFEEAVARRQGLEKELENNLMMKKMEDVSSLYN